MSETGRTDGASARTTMQNQEMRRELEKAKADLDRARMTIVRLGSLVGEAHEAGFISGGDARITVNGNETPNISLRA